MMTVLQWGLVLLAGYAVVGVGVAVWFVAWGAGARDPVARAAPLRVRVLFGPGAVAVWPAILLTHRRPGAVEAHAPEGS